MESLELGGILVVALGLVKVMEKGITLLIDRRFSDNKMGNCAALTDLEKHQIQTTYENTNKIATLLRDNSKTQEAQIDVLKQIANRLEEK